MKPVRAQQGRRQIRPRLAWPYLFVLPFILIFLIFTVYPIVFTAQLSLTSWHGSGTALWVGLENYRYLLTNPDFWGSLVNSAWLWVLIIPVQMALAVLAAVLLNMADLSGRGIYRVIFIIPYVTPLVAIAQIWTVLFDSGHGAVNAALGLVGLPEVGWLTTVPWAKPTLALLFLWKSTGFVIIILLSGLQSIDPDIYEAAAIDGAGSLRRLASITIPLLRPTLAFALVMQTLGVFQMFAEPFVMTQGGPYRSTTTAGYYLYNHITRGDLGTGAANSLLLVIVVMAASLVFVRLLRGKE